MKKAIRIISVLLCAVMLGILLCSCTYLDEQKAMHAVYTGDSETNLTFRGYTYQKIDLPSNISFLMNEYKVANAYLTEKDVPVLLSKRFGSIVWYNSDEENPVLLHGNTTVGDFVREDRYEEISGKVFTAKMDHYALYDYIQPYAYGMERSYEVTLKLISDEAINAINDSLKSGNKVSYKEITANTPNSISLIQCDQDMLLTNQCNVHLYQDGDRYYLLQTVNEVAYDENVVEVPEKYNDEIKNLFTEYRESVYPASVDDYFYYGANSGWGNSEDHSTEYIGA